MDEFKLKEGLVITEDLDKEKEVDNKKIVYKPLWTWLLELR
jgi:predicted AAA+ superfamily ATPase